MTPAGRPYRRCAREDITDRSPGLIDGRCTHPEVGFLLLRSREHGLMVLGPDAARYLDDHLIDVIDPAAPAADPIVRADLGGGVTSAARHLANMGHTRVP